MALNIDLLESSFNSIAPHADELAKKFYERLFREYPQVRPMFTTAPEEQEQKLIASLVMIVTNLRNHEALVKTTKELGIRHIQYSVQREHYPIVGKVLLASLAEVAGPAWNKELNDAWTQAYQTIQGIIFEALDEHDRAAAA